MESCTLPTESEIAARSTARRQFADRVVELAGQLNAIHAQLTAVVAEGLADDLWDQGAVRTPEQFLPGKPASHPTTPRP